MRTMKCKDLEMLMADYLSGDLNEQDRKALECHLSQCSTCDQMVLEMRSNWQKVQAMPEQDPGPELRSKFYTMLAEEKAKGSRSFSIRKKLNDFLNLFWPKEPVKQLGFTFAIVIIALLLNNTFRTQIHSNGELAVLKEELQVTRQTVSTVLLERDAATDRLQGIQFTKQISDPNDALLDKLLDHLNHDPNLNVRLAAVDALYIFGNHLVVQNKLSASLQNQRSPLVQIALIDLLSDLRIKRANEALKSLIENKSVEIEVRNHAQDRLKSMM